MWGRFGKGCVIRLRQFKEVRIPGSPKWTFQKYWFKKDGCGKGKVDGGIGDRG